MQNLNNNIMFILLPVNVIVPRTLLNGNRQLINHQTHLSVLHYFAYPLVAQYASSDRDTCSFVKEVFIVPTYTHWWVQSLHSI